MRRQIFLERILRRRAAVANNAYQIENQTLEDARSPAKIQIIVLGYICNAPGQWQLNRRVRLP
jgi:hypothetical protein